MGWNSLRLHADSPLLAGVDAAATSTLCTPIGPIRPPALFWPMRSTENRSPAVVGRGQVFGCQFHPEERRGRADNTAEFLEDGEMILFPAIDMIGGKCVRLVRGDYATAAQMADDILETAQHFAFSGCGWLHMVDLDGAKQKKPVNAGQVRRVLENIGLRVQIGGGIRTLADMEFYRSLGAHRIILGSVAVSNKPLTKLAVSMFGDRLAVGIDARGGRVATNGWLEQSDVDYITLAKEMESIGVKPLSIPIFRATARSRGSTSRIWRRCRARCRVTSSPAAASPD